MLASSEHKLKAKDINIQEYNFLIDNFITGARTELYLPDFKTCKDKMIFGYKDFLRLGSFFLGKDPDFMPDVYNIGYNITATIGEMGKWIRTCYGTERDVEVGLIQDYMP